MLPEKIIMKIKKITRIKKAKRMWYTPHKLVTFLEADAIEMRLKNRTIPEDNRTEQPSEKEFFVGKIENKKFRMDILKGKIPSCWRTIILPKVTGEIIEDTTGKCIIYVRLEAEKDWGVYFVFLTIAFSFHKVAVLLYVVAVLLGYILFQRRWEKIGSCVIEWLKVLLKAEEKL